MFTKHSQKNKIRLMAFMAIFSLILSLAPGLTTGTAFAEGSVDPLIQGEPVTPMQIQLADAIRQLAAQGQPAPSVTFNAETSQNPGGSGALGPSLNLAEETLAIKTVATTILEYRGPQDAGYAEWPPIEVKGDLAGDGLDPFTTGDLTEIIRASMAEDPEWSQVAFGHEARRYTITETIEQSPVADPPVMNSLGLIQASEAAATAEDILMGFTFTGPHIRYFIEQKVEPCINIWFTKICKELLYVKAGFELDSALGLRLPANATLNEMAPGSTNAFETALQPEDWSAEEYAGQGVAPEDGNEFLLRLDFFAGVLVRVVGKAICPLPVCYVEMSKDYSQSFTTPLGLDMNFPIEPLTIPLFTIEPLGGILTASVNLLIQPLITSSKITANWTASAGEGCSQTGVIEYKKPGEAVGINPNAACFTGNPNPTQVTVDKFRYYFNEFGLAFSAGVSVDIAGIWEGTYSKEVFRFYLSDIFGPLPEGLTPFIGDHNQCTLTLIPKLTFTCGRAGPDNLLLLSESPDTTPPVITYTLDPAPNANGWNSDEVTLTWTVTENESSIISQTGCDAQTFSIDQETNVTCEAVSSGGLGSKTAFIKIDKTAPVLTCPEGGPFLLNSGDITIGPVDVDASISGLDSGADNVLVGTVNTTTVGPKAIEFKAKDMAGNSASLTCSYDVFYNFSAFLPPVYPMNIGKAGRTFPVKWQLSDNSGAYIGDLTTVTSIIATPSDQCGVGSTVALLQEYNNSDSSLHYDSTANQFIYNWRTPSTAGCFSLVLTLASGQTGMAYFDLR